ncbi:YncE family protein [Candidatus Woesearchaeota archaeon]|nr:YncE family protein [Candidatus Woesearchaeota archaeon]
MKKVFLLILLIACSQANEKIFVANEEAGTISIIDATTLKEIERVTLSNKGDDYLPHNIQTVGNLVLITANHYHGAHDESSHSHTESVEMNKHMDDHGETHAGNHDLAAEKPTIAFGIVTVEAHEGEEEAQEIHPDQLVIMDAKTHKITERINLDVEAHLAHVVSDGENAYITATNKNLLYIVNLENKNLNYIELGNSSPHGIRLTPDKAIIAGMNNQLQLVDLRTNKVETIKLPGKAVQTGYVTGKALATIYDTKQIAIYDLTSKKLEFVNLTNAKGPIQLYPTPNEKYIYVADQGVYFAQPPGTNTYKINLETKQITTIPTGQAPHGVVVSPDGRVWVTNLQGNTVSLLENDKKTAEIDVGVLPNGITYWSKV